jgi:hypothetical protein
MQKVRMTQIKQLQPATPAKEVVDAGPDTVPSAAATVPAAWPSRVSHLVPTAGAHRPDEAGISARSKMKSPGVAARRSSRS